MRGVILDMCVGLIPELDYKSRHVGRGGGIAGDTSEYDEVREGAK